VISTFRLTYDNKLQRFNYTKWHQNFVGDIQNDDDLDKLLSKTKDDCNKQKKIMSEA